MKKNRKSFSTRLSLSIVLVVSILYITAIAVASISSHILLSREAEKSAGNLLRATISDMERVINSIETMTRDAAGVCYSNPKKESFVRQVETSMLQGNPYILSSTVAFAPGYVSGKRLHAPKAWKDEESGQILAKNLGKDKVDYLSRDWYQIPYLTGKAVWTEPYFDSETTDKVVVTYSYPLKDTTGTMFAVVAADIDLTWVVDTIKTIRPYEHSYVVLVTKCGQLITMGEESSFGNGETIFSYALSSKDPDMFLISRDMVEGVKGMRVFNQHTRNMSFAVYGPLTNGWSAAIVCNYRDVLASTRIMQNVLMLLGLFGLLVIFALCYATIRKMTKPLSEFSDSALNIANGDFDTKLPDIRSNDEIKQLRDSFEYMEQSLTSYIENLKITTAANERFESELNIARNIQMHMVPTDFPERDDLDIHALLQPAREVGGDLYDFLVKEDVVYLAIGDVSGKGMPAALVMSNTKAALRFTTGDGASLDTIMSRINRSVAEGNDSEMFVTLFIGKIDLKTRKFQYCNAGHNPIIVNGGYIKVNPNIAAGLFPDYKYTMDELTLPPDSRIILYTDGVTEAETATQEQFGEQRLLEWAKNVPDGMTAEEATADLMADIHGFTGGNEQNDDITIMTIKL